MGAGFQPGGAPGMLPSTRPASSYDRGAPASGFLRGPLPASQRGAVFCGVGGGRPASTASAIGSGLGVTAETITPSSKNPAKPNPTMGPHPRATGHVDRLCPSMWQIEHAIQGGYAVASVPVEQRRLQAAPHRPRFRRLVRSTTGPGSSKVAPSSSPSARCATRAAPRSPAAMNLARRCTSFTSGAPLSPVETSAGAVETSAAWAAPPFGDVLAPGSWRFPGGSPPSGVPLQVPLNRAHLELAHLSAFRGNAGGGRSSTGSSWMRSSR
jgi:hypothetical protein